MERLTSIFGAGEQLTPSQMGARALVMFFVALALVRLSGMRTFGRKSAFDQIVAIVLGAVLARGIVGASPLGSSIAAGAVLVLVHRILAHLCLRFSWLEDVVKGQQRLLYKDGRCIEATMARSAISRNDLLEGVRQAAGARSLDEVDEVYIDSSGEISVVMRREGAPRGQLTAPAIGSARRPLPSADDARSSA